MESFRKFMSVLFMPIIVLNVVGAIGSGIWLAALGKWTLIGYGIAVLFISSFILNIAMLPGLLFSAPAVLLHEKGSKVGFYLFEALASLYSAAVITAWCIAVYYLFSTRANSGTLIPILIWGYTVATTPISMKASGGGDSLVFFAFSTKIAFITLILVVLFYSVPLFKLIVLFASIIFLGQLIRFILMLKDDGFTPSKE